MSCCEPEQQGSSTPSSWSSIIAIWLAACSALWPGDTQRQPCQLLGVLGSGSLSLCSKSRPLDAV